MAIEVPHSPTIEATSLATVLQLASNPPRHPTLIKPGTAPLVLYIARVPGSRDVFLTPIKPREKVVTASDVQSSLYYVHVNCAESSQQSDPKPAISCVNGHHSGLPTLSEIPRRKAVVPPPLPKRAVERPAPPYPLDTGPPVLPPRPDISPQQVMRRPVLPQRSSRRSSGNDLPVLAPRPLPPTPTEDQLIEHGSPSLHDDNVRLLRRESHVDEINNPYTRDYPNHPETIKRRELDSRPEPGTLTLIRRDPGSNEQWNVAMIHDPSVQEVSSSSILVPTAKRRTKKGGAPMYVDITNPGYIQFISSLSRSESRTSAESSSEDGEPEAEGVFRRRLYMPGSKFADHGYTRNGRGKQHSVSSLSMTNEIPTIPTALRAQRHSVDFGGIDSNPLVDRRSKGYTFTSPWDGRCEFTTGPTGRTLKCRHHFSRNTSGQIVAVEVSELRFNLPTTAKSAYTPASPRTSYFAGRPHLFDSSFSEDRSQSPTIVLNEDGRIDLSLGQERAGGGVGGKQAKLGKLIIEPEGFGMLDLLVASNLGLWWRAWERV